MKFLNIFGMIAFVYAFVLAGPEVEGRMYPVLKNMVVVGKVHVNNDVVLTVQVTKARNCKYIALWRARTTTGRMLQIVHDPVDGPNWDKGRISSQFRVVGAGKETFTLTAEHQCHLGWNVFSQLGQIE